MTANAASGRPAVAVIGSGVAGLTAAHLLQRRYDVRLFEADDRLGGHAHTHDVALTHGRVAGLDSGFLVHNDRTYPNLLRLFAELGVATQDSDMSMSVALRRLRAGVRRGEGAGRAVRPAVRGSGPRYLAMLAQVKYFHRRARAVLDGGDDSLTLGEFLAARPVHRLLRPPLHAAAGRRGLVVRVRRRPRTTRPATCSPSWTTTACSPSPGRRSGGRWSAAPRPTSSGRPRTSPRCTPPPRSDRVHRHADGSRSATTPTSPPGRPGRHRGASGPGAVPAGRRHPRTSRGCWARSSTCRAPRCCTPTPRCCPAPPGRGRPGTTGWRTAAPTTSGSGSATTSSRLQRIADERDYVVTLNDDGE